MSQVWSEINKVVQGTPPSADVSSSTGVQTDFVDMEGYKRCTFLFMTSTAADNNLVITVQAGISSTSCATEIAFKYRSIITGDTYGALQTAVAGTGFNLSTGTANQYHIIEVDAQTVAAADINFDHVALTHTETTGHTGTLIGAVIIILSEPRYPQAILPTAIG